MLRRRNTTPLLVAGILTATGATGVPLRFHPHRANEVAFPATQARFVRVHVYSAPGQPCIDELEAYGGDPEVNLARSGIATASSCLPGYPIHRIRHLNDGRYGNARSWIAAGHREEWAQVELAEPAVVSMVVLSRDREGQFSDRVPTRFDVRLSLDGETWTTVQTVETRVIQPRHVRQPAYAGPFPLPQDPSWHDLLTYAFDAERHTWEHVSKTDPLSPHQCDHPYWRHIAQLSAVERTLVQLKELADRLEVKGVDVSAERAEWERLRVRAHDATSYHDARLAKRRLLFRDPDLAPLGRILFVKRYPYHASHNYSDVLDSAFRPGGGIYVLESPGAGTRLDAAGATLTRLFDGSGGIARDPVADFDARRIYFAYRPEENPRTDWEPYWHLMAMNADGSGLEKLTGGPFHDMHPCPLPDGGLAFISTRCKARFLCWRPQAFVMFRMGPDGAKIRPLSYANLSEWTPSTLRDGRILWTRSEYIDKGADFGHTLWAIRPDGTHPELVFGNNTPNCYINGKEVPGSRELCATIFSHGGDHNGPIGLIDPSGGPFDPGALVNITPDVTPHYNMSWPRYECFRDPTPISRDYILVSHAPAGRFGLYVIDRYGNRELLYMDPEIGSMCPTPLRPTPRPPVIASGIAGGSATLFVSDVYRGLGPEVARGTVKYLRVCEEVRAGLLREPDGEYRHDHPSFQDWYATPIHRVQGPFGWPSYVAKASLGLAPVHPDGSAHFTVPAGKVIYFQALDEDHNEVQRMRSVMQLQPGEQRSCVGCHEDRLTTPPARVSTAAQRAPTDLDPPPWGAVPFAYEAVVQPVLDKHCAECHGAGDLQGINLTGMLDEGKVPASYRTLIEGGWVHYFNCQYALRHHKAPALTFGTVKSKLWPILNKGHYQVELGPDEIRAVKCWIDLNAPLWPDYTYGPDRPTDRKQVLNNADETEAAGPDESQRPPPALTQVIQ